MPSHISVVCLACIIFVIICSTSMAAPRSRLTKRQSPPWHEIVDECKQNESIEATCQLCAKETKSIIVYPMCCEQREEARKWCVRYLSYGLKQDSD